MCGRSFSAAQYMGDRAGLSLEFPFPHLLGENICQNRFLEIYSTPYGHFSTLRSLYLTDENLYYGLHNAYIKRPQNSPLIFNKEQAAGDWWNDEIKPASLSRLAEMELDYHQIVEHNLTPKVKDQDIEDEWWYSRLMRWAVPWVDNGTQQDVARYPSTNSLTVSLVNELYHYQMAAQRVLEDPTEANEIFIGFRRCIVDLMNSIPEKKYRVVQSQCNATVEDVKRFFTTPDGQYNSGTGLVQFIAGFDGMAPEQTGLLPTGLEIPIFRVEKNATTIRHRVLIEIGQHMLMLVNETAQYNDMANESFNFDLENKE